MPRCRRLEKRLLWPSSAGKLGPSRCKWKAGEAAATVPSVAAVKCTVLLRVRCLWAKVWLIPAAAAAAAASSTAPSTSRGPCLPGHYMATSAAAAFASSASATAASAARTSCSTSSTWTIICTTSPASFVTAVSMAANSAGH